MKLTQHLIITAAAIVVTSCTAFNAPRNPDLNGDDVISKDELDAHHRRLEAGMGQQQYDTESLYRLEEMMKMGERAFDRFDGF